MIVTGEAKFTSVQSGVSAKTGKEYFRAKFLDSDAEEFITFFIDEEVCHGLESLKKGAPVILTLSLALASKYFRLESVEPIETRFPISILMYVQY